MQRLLGQREDAFIPKECEKISEAGTERKETRVQRILQKLIDRCQVRQDLIGQGKTSGLCLQRDMKREDFRHVCVHVVTQRDVSFVYLLITVPGICCCTSFLVAVASLVEQEL